MSNTSLQNCITVGLYIGWNRHIMSVLCVQNTNSNRFYNHIQNDITKHKSHCSIWGSHSSVGREPSLLGYNIGSGMQLQTFRRTTVPSHSESNSLRRLSDLEEDTMILWNASTSARKEQHHIPEGFTLAQVTLSHWQQAYIWQSKRWLLLYIQTHHTLHTLFTTVSWHLLRTVF